MRSNWVTGLGALLLTAGTARAEGPHATSAERDTDAYCRWVTATAASESDPFLLPSVYASAGYVSGADATEGASALPPTQRVIAGAVYNFGATGLNRGLALRAQAEAECKRYATTAVLRAFIERHQAPVSARGLALKAKILDEALPRAAEILATQKQRLAQVRMTVEEVDATQLRVDAMRALAADTHAQLDAQASAPPVPNQPIRDVLAQRDAAESEAEKKDARVRESRGWDLSVRGGYDRIFGVRDYTPVFAMATVTLNLGWFLQGANDDRAETARREWVRSEVLGFDDRVEQVVQTMKATRDAEVGRLRESAILLADLEQRYKAVSSLEGEKARGYAESVWFDLVRVRAEHAYLEAHVRELGVLLGEGGGS